jgi:hypothetical protein
VLPCKVQPLGSSVLAKIPAELREDGISRADIAAALAVHVEEIDQLVFCLGKR